MAGGITCTVAMAELERVIAAAGRAAAVAGKCTATCTECREAMATLATELEALEKSAAVESTGLLSPESSGAGGRL